MNFLSHLFLSQGVEPIMIGNFIGDFVKGKAFENFEPQIRQGILLHREIDMFTDQHAIVRQSKERLWPGYKHYAAVIVDIYYDHFLAKLWDNYHEKPLLTFTEDFYQLAKTYEDIIPPAANHMLTYMEKDNWLYNYQYVTGIHQALSGMARRTSFISRMEHASKDLEKDYDLYEEEFIRFFEEIQAFTKSKLAT